MKLKFFAGVAACLVAAPAAAQTCQFSLTGTVTASGAAQGTPLLSQFQLGCNQTPDLVDVPNQNFFYSSVPGVFDGPGIGGNNGQGTAPLLASDIGFYPLSNGGGFSANYPDDGSVNGGFGLFSLLGAQLYTGSLSNPTFTPGIYTFTDDYYYGSVAGGTVVGTLTITALPAVPEVATWAMMIAGFGVVGFAMRRRPSAVRTTVRFA